VGLDSAVEILGTYAGQASDLKFWFHGAEINRDRNLRLQYLAGLAVDDNREEIINAEMLVFRHFPANLFAGSDQEVSALRLRPGWK
jgi:spermidine synthase